MKKLFSLVIFLSLFFAFVPHIHADENFDVKLASVYTVSSNGTTLVQQRFQITNKKPIVFAKQYALEVGSNKLQNIKAFDGTSTIPSQVVTNTNKTTIALTFADEVVGEGKTRNFTIQFTNPDTAIISGTVLEVYVPRLSNIENYSSYAVTLHIPNQFGAPARVSPSNYRLQQDNSRQTLVFDSLHGESISALFGQKQIFDYTLRYNLENPTGNTGVIQVALPPDTDYQKVVYTSLDPQPQEMSRDSDGNWIATYQIAAQNSLEVYLTGKAYIYLAPQRKNGIQGADSTATQPQPYWESNTSQIKDLAKKYSTPKAIYDYAVSQLSYNYEKVNGTVERLGALGSLAQPKNAVCQEFTDLFIAIARAAGIPARRNTGFAYTANNRLRPLSLVDDVLHAWPEYYDQSQKAWIPVDPTWGNTTGGINYFDQFDFNHLVFAINGDSSTTPYAAGSYKKENQNTKDVEVKFGREETIPNLQLKLQLNTQPELSLSWPPKQEYLLKVTNQTGVAFYDLPITLQTNTPNVQVSPAPTHLDYLLPFQTREVKITAQSATIFRLQSFRLTAQVGSLSSSYDLQTGLTIQSLQKFLPEIVVGGCMVLITILTWRLLVSRRKRQRPLRR